MRKRYAPQFKADTVVEAFKEDLTVAQIGSDKQVHPTQIHAWKAHALRELHLLFEPQSQRDGALKAEYEKKIHELYAEIGKLTTQVEWLKKKSGIETLPK
jgi:transposase